MVLHPVLALELRHLVLAELQHALDRARLVVAAVLHVLERDLESQLAQRPLVQGLPVVHLLRHRVGAAVVVQLDEPRVEVRDDLGDEHAVGEVARDVSLRPRQRDLVDPLVQRLELGVGNLHGTSMRRGRCVAAPWREIRLACSESERTGNLARVAATLGSDDAPAGEKRKS